MSVGVFYVKYGLVTCRNYLSNGGVAGRSHRMLGVDSSTFAQFRYESIPKTLKGRAPFRQD